jgi:hypothetical protein
VRQGIEFDGCYFAILVERVSFCDWANPTVIAKAPPISISFRRDRRVVVGGAEIIPICPRRTTQQILF